VRRTKKESDADDTLAVSSVLCDAAPPGSTAHSRACARWPQGALVSVHQDVLVYPLRRRRRSEENKREAAKRNHERTARVDARFPWR
jgi:hypothetical protein